MTAFEQFRETFPGYTEYRSPENDAFLKRYTEDTFPPEQRIFGAYEITFGEAVRLGKIEKNPNYLPPNFRRELDAMPSEAMKARYLADPEFAHRVNLVGEIDNSRDATDPYAELSGQSFRSIAPDVRTRLLQTNPHFQAAHKRLLARGEL